MLTYKLQQVSPDPINALHSPKKIESPNDKEKLSSTGVNLHASKLYKQGCKFTQPF